MSQIPPSSSSEPSSLAPQLIESREHTNKLQMTFALIVGLIMVAIPLYLWKRPLKEPTIAPALSAEARLLDSSSLSPLAVPATSTTQASAAPALTLGETKINKCRKTGSARASSEPCDRQPFFEEALAKAIQNNVSCTPTSVVGGGTVNFVLDVDYQHKKLHTWAGKSSSIPKKLSKGLVACVSRSLPIANWEQLPHQNNHYQITLQATYPASSLLHSHSP